MNKLKELIIPIIAGIACGALVLWIMEVQEVNRLKNLYTIEAQELNRVKDSNEMLKNNIQSCETLLHGNKNGK